jgi:hypothetical protein
LSFSVFLRALKPVYPLAGGEFSPSRFRSTPKRDSPLSGEGGANIRIV